MRARVVPGLLREPLIQFLLLGAVLFGVDRYVLGNAENPREIVVDAEKRAELSEIFRDGQGRYPEPDELDDLIVQWTQNEILYREARLMGLDQGDDMIRQRLILKIRNVLFNRVTTQMPSDAELKAWFEERRAAYDKPARYDFEQFLVPTGSASDASEAESIARELAGALGTRPPPDEQRNQVRRYLRRPRSNLTTAFGADEAQRLLDSPDNTWVAVRSERGWHLARITRRLPAEPAAFELVRARVAADWKDASARLQLAQAVTEIADQYHLKLDP